MVELYGFGPRRAPFRISFTGGGEPTFHWGLFKEAVSSIIEECNSAKIDYELFLTTNGILDDPKREFISRNFHNVLISYDGCSKTNYLNRPFFNGLDPSPIVEETIDYLIDHKTNFSVRSTIWMEDMRNLKKYSDWIIERFGNINWTINLVMPHGRAKGKQDVPEDMSKVVSDYLKVFADRNQKLSRYTDCSAFNRDVVPLMCGGVLPLCSNLWLKPDGEIVTCIEECEQTHIAKVTNEGLVYYTTCSDKLLEYIQTNLPICKNCIAYRFCKGGCPARHEMYEELGGDNMECLLIQHYWKQVFEAMIDGEPFFDMYLKPSPVLGPDVLEIVTPSTVPKDDFC